ncbi:MAG TPA: sulfotransferase [Rubrivivax sp.]|nr:sulfotransferase [Rubrivivax sp.]
MAFDIDALLQEARRRAGGPDDFGAADFRPALQALLQALDGQARLSAVGRQLLHERIVELLRNRLLVEDHFRRLPEIAAEEIRSPLVIVGLPRTGTTLLQRILGCDARLYPLLWWETRFPVPLPAPETSAQAMPGAALDPRIERARAEVAAMLAAMPKLAAIHPLDAEAADEDGILLEHSFCAFFDAYADIPGYTRWLQEHDPQPAYRHLRRLLQFLQWQKRRRGETASSGRWVLKTPHHLRQLDVLCAVFPDAQIVQTHRDPLQTIPSIASFNETLWQIYGEKVDPLRVGRQWSAIFARGMQRSLEFRARESAAGRGGRFHDVWFDDTLREPLAVVRKLYAFAGLSLPGDVEGRMQHYLVAHRRETRPAHDYSLEHFGLSTEQIGRDFAAYREAYILSPH